MMKRKNRRLSKNWAVNRRSHVSKGLGEISPQEFARFIGPDMRVQPVMIMPETHIQQLLEYFMGKNTPQRQDFIIGNLRMEIDHVE